MNIEEAATKLIKKLNERKVDLSKYDIHKIAKMAKEKGISN